MNDTIVADSTGFTVIPSKKPAQITPEVAQSHPHLVDELTRTLEEAARAKVATQARRIFASRPNNDG